MCSDHSLKGNDMLGYCAMGLEVTVIGRTVGRLRFREKLVYKVQEKSNGGEWKEVRTEERQ